VDRGQAKRNAAVEAVRRIEDGMTVGLGTGSTAAFVVELLGERVAGGLGIRGLPTSEATAAKARAAGIPLVGLDQVENVDITIDGADEITRDGSAIKGGGGALLREKVVAAVTRRLRIAVVDEMKVVKQLGAFPLPVEVIPFARPAVARAIQRLGGNPDWRRLDGSAVLTDNGNHLLDVRFGVRSDGDWAEIARRLEAMPGVVAHGLFLECFDLIVVGHEAGVTAHEVARAEPGRFPLL
jgi:ribose 5-phosphate isomerase A